MPIIFHTDHVNKRFVRRTIENTIINLTDYKPYNFLEAWNIHVWGLKDTNPKFFEHIKTTSGMKINTDMPSGVTGKFRMDLWLHDSSNDFKARENSDRIMHEVCHALLIGTRYFVTGVHSNLNNRFKVSFWYWDRFKFKKFYLSVIDIRRYL